MTQWTDITKTAFQSPLLKPGQKWSLIICGVRPYRTSTGDIACLTTPGLLDVELGNHGVLRNTFTRKSLQNKFGYSWSFPANKVTPADLKNFKDKNGAALAQPIPDIEAQTLLQISTFSDRIFGEFKGQELPYPDEIDGKISESGAIHDLSIQETFGTFAKMIIDHLASGQAPTRGTIIAAQPYRVQRKSRLN